MTDLIFIHIPKNAGNSVKSVVCPQYVDYEHKRAIDIWSEIGDYKFDSSVKFCVVRHPCDRLLSCYSWLMQQQPDKSPQIEYYYSIANQYSCLEELVLNIDALIFIEQYFIPQTRWITINGKLSCDFVLKYETLESEWSSFARNFNLPETLPKLNVSNHPNWKDCFTPAMIARFRAVYSEELNLLGYLL